MPAAAGIDRVIIGEKLRRIARSIPLADPRERRPPPTKNDMRRRAGMRLGRACGSTGFLTSRSFPMSPAHLATALVVPFEQLRMTDVEVGGRQERLASAR
ncbi:MAG: hypothetical protein MZW92_54760 [Comamonadaceae bacterium]|nr:hypothetical protein [Comamonadaceae bacterium]